MNIIAVDHDKKNLAHLEQFIRDVEPDAEVTLAENFDKALKLMEEHEFDLAFLEPEQKKGITAVEFASKLKEKNRDAHIIFMSKSESAMPDAFSVHADAYLIKPIKSEDISREIDYLMNRYPAPLRPVKLIVRTFGSFEVFYRGKRLLFKRNKSKELLAILVDNRGVGLTTRVACSMLFGGRKYDEILLGYFHVVLTSLKTTLDGYGIKGLLRKTVNYIAINPDLIDCDMYRYLKGEPEAVNDYHGDYMTGYSWSEYSPLSFRRGNEEEVNAG